MSESRIKKTILAQIPPEAIPAIGEAVSEVGKAAKGIIDKAEDVGGENHRGDQVADGDDFLNDLNTAQQAGREQFVGFGLDKNTYDEYTQKLIQLGMPSFMNPATFLQDLASIASLSSVTIQDVFPVAEAIYLRNIHSPERALAILRVIAKYESKVPGLGLFDMAKDAALGTFNPQSLAIARYSLMGIPGSKGNMNETRDLQQAFDGINAPNSELGADLNDTNLSHQRMQATQESLLMHTRRLNLEIRKKRDQKLTEIYDTINKSLPDWVKNNTFFIRTLMEGLSGVTMFNAVKNTVMQGAGMEGKTGLGNLPHEKTPPIGFINKGASVNPRQYKTAQSAGTAPTDLNAPAPAAQTPTPVGSPAQAPEQVMYQNMQQANSGFNNNLAQQGLQSGIFTTEQANHVNELQSLIATRQATLEANYANLTEMINAGLAGQSRFDSDQNGAAYVTPEQMEAYAKQADTNANVLIQLIQTLLVIFSDVAKNAQKMQSNPQVASLLLNVEANYRTMLRTIQQMRIKIFDVSVIGTIDQRVKLLEPTYEELKANIDMMRAFNNVGADTFVMPFVQITQQMSALYFEAAQKYQTASSNIQAEPAMAQYCQQRSKQMNAAGTKARAEGVVALRELMKQQGGSAVASTSNKFIRLGEEIVDEELEGNKEIEAKPLPVDEYWDNLYQDKPPYGDVMVHPEKHRNEPSWKMKSKHKIKRIH